MEAQPATDRLVFVPPTAWQPALSQPVTRNLVVTAAGLFPHATGHVCHRPRGIGEVVLLVCVNGGGWLTMAGLTHQVAANQAVLLPANHPYSYGADPEQPWSIWWCHLRGAGLDDLAAVAGVSTAHPVITPRYPERMVAAIDHALSGLASDHAPARLIDTSGVIWRMFTRLALERVSPEAGDPLERAMAHLTERYATTVRVPELAHLVGLSSSHLTALFRAATGGGVLAFQTSIRMARARELLDTTTLPVGQIATDVGYPDAFYFSRRFRDWHQLTPTQYRARAKA